MMTLARVGVAAALLGGALAGVAQAAPFSTGFEAPTYVPGPVSDQDGWYLGSLSGWGRVQSGVVHSGGQALAFDGTDYGNFALNMRDVNVGGEPGAGPVVRASLWAYASGNASSLFWEVMGFLGNGGYLEQVTMNDGLAAFGGNWMPVATGTWNEFTTELDLSTQTATAYVNGVLLGSAPFFTSGNTSVTQLLVGLNGYWEGGTDFGSFYVDDLRLEAVPEPTGLAVMAFGVAALGLVRRRVA